jgi:SAM-dependent methyltransferase
MSMNIPHTNTVATIHLYSIRSVVRRAVAVINTQPCRRGDHRVRIYSLAPPMTAPTDYEQLAQRYDEDRARFSIPRDDVIATLIPSRSAVRILDLGCGTGLWIAAQRDMFATSDVSFLGVDPSSAMLAEARAKGVSRLVCARAEHLPLADASVAYVITSYCFHHFTDKDRALDEVARVVTPESGVVRINNIDPGTAAGWWVYEFFPEAIAIDAARFWPPARIAEALEARGFVVDVEVDSASEELPAREALTDAERRVVSQLAVLDDAAYARGLDRLRRFAAAHDANLTTTTSRLCLTARRDATTGTASPRKAATYR